MSREGGRGTHFHEGGTRPSRQTPSFEQKQKQRDGHRIKREVQTKRYSSSKAEDESQMCSAETGGVGAASGLEDSVDKQIQRGPVSTLQLCKDNEH